MQLSYLASPNFWTPIQKYETELPINRGSISPSIKGTQFPLTLTWVSTVHKFQGLSLEQCVIDFDLRKQK